MRRPGIEPGSIAFFFRLEGYGSATKLPALNYHIKIGVLKICF